MPPRVGVSWVGDPRQPREWSGTPAGLIRGLEDAGAQVIPINVDPPPVLRYGALTLFAIPYLRRVRPLGRAQAVARLGGAMARLRTGLAALRAPRGETLDGVIQLGTGYVLPPSLRTVTFEDITVPLIARGGGRPLWQLLPPRVVRRRIAIQAAAYERSHACCVTSPWVADALIAEYGVSPDRVHVVGVGRNHEVAPGDRDWSCPRFLFVGLDWEGKNGPAVVRAFERLHASIPEARLDVVGGHPPLRSPGVTGHGRLRLDRAEERGRMTALFAQATCFVMPSRMEPAGIAYVEAAAGGVASIGTQRGGAPFLIGDGGLTVDPNDDRALLAAMLELADPDTAARLGALARARSRLFTWRAVAERLLAALTLPSLSRRELAPFL
jgi:glycosyltransferase involved in cell wall biosynthesis